MIMTQFIDSKMKNSGKLEETKPRTDSGRHRYMGRGITRTGGSCGDKLVTHVIKLSLSGEEPCRPSPLDPEPVPSGVVTQTARAGMFMASSEISNLQGSILKHT